MRKILIFILAIIFVSGAFFAVNLYNKGHDDLSEISPEISLSATQLFDDYSQNEATANQKYLDKIIEIDGRVSKVEKDEKGDTQLYLESNDPMFGIICNMVPGFQSTDINRGDPLVIRGICSGYLMDVALNRCVLIK